MQGSGVGSWVVTADGDDASRRRAAGEHVVVVVAPGGPVPDGGGPGRVAVLVGDPADPATWDAARELAGELSAGDAAARRIRP